MNAGDVAARFVQAASRYCALLERAGSRPHVRDDEYSEKLHCMLAEAYASAAALPSHGELAEAAEASVGFPDTIYKTLREFLGDRDVYALSFSVDDPDIVEQSLSADLVEIYRELKSVGQYAAGNDAPAALPLRNWRFAFDSHWGRHAINALAVLRSL
jgi:Domain of unknown function (DUF5063)